ncbi:hypothetical protein LMG29542_08217 [Paraburkholderia humisilvae]|uniref:Uncharacterized protein n=1 Tax=Paraburkholderia humisilvae TaxID=627669 RepID=A0A6J5FC85_9BURK|nr:hypothetical protein LMG29542_08217 [Paraburkholderia humisilvae]
MRRRTCSWGATCLRESSSASSVPKNDSHIALIRITGRAHGRLHAGFAATPPKGNERILTP